MDDTNGDSHLAGSDFDSLFTEGGPSAQRSTKHQAPYDLLLASQTSSDTTSQTGRTRVDGKEFFCQVSSVTLKSSDDKLFEVDTVVVLQSKIIKQIIEDDCAVGAIPLFNVDSVTLEKVIDYCKKHAEVTGSTDDDDLKAWDIDFVTVDKDRLLDLAKPFDSHPPAQPPPTLSLRFSPSSPATAVVLPPVLPSILTLQPSHLRFFKEPGLITIKTLPAQTQTQRLTYSLSPSNVTLCSSSSPSSAVSSHHGSLYLLSTRYSFVLFSCFIFSFSSHSVGHSLFLSLFSFVDAPIDSEVYRSCERLTDHLRLYT